MKIRKNLLLVLSALLLVTGCDFGKDSSSSEEQPQGPAALLELDEYKAYIAKDLDNVKTSIGELKDATVSGNVNAAYQAGKTAINGAQSKADAEAAFATAKAAMANAIPLANGLYDYTSLTGDDRNEILGIVEAYGVRNGMTGLSLFEDGGYVMYSDRVTLGTENYIIGYGFGTLAEGSINADMAKEENANWKRYYHTFDSSDPGTANYLNDQGSQVGDYYGYFAASYFTNFMNDTKDGYTWVPELADSLPEKADEEGKVWKFEVKTGNKLKYSTNSQNPARKAFNNREVAKEDYVTAFKLLLNAKNELYRGSELANSSTGAIKGAKEYYEATKEAADATAAAAIDFSSVGVKTYEEGGKTYFEVEFTNTTSQFNAMYYISSSLYQPIPQEFIDQVGVKALFGYNEDKSTTPVDNSLSLGAYTLETWETDKQVVYKKNPNYVFADTKYSIPGVHISIRTAAQNDAETGIKAFINGELDSSGIPQTKLDEYKNDPRTRQTVGTSNFKLNVNALSQEDWVKFFGTDGVVTQTPESEYWQCKPCLSNEHFIKALSLSINRDQFGAARGSVGSVNYFSPNYMSSSTTTPVLKADSGKAYDYFEVVNVSYNSTEDHKKAIAANVEGTDNGYALDMARDYFKLALEELEAEGKYTRGTPENPTVIDLEIAWQRATHEELYHNEIKQYLETAFNDESVSGRCYKLNVNFWVGTVWSDVYYNKMMVGQYDIGFGSISGNTLNPLDFMSVLSTDQSISSGFTLNWAVDTNDPEADILVYDGLRWSYDALWKASNEGCIVKNGAFVAPYVIEVGSNNAGEGAWTTTIKVTENSELVQVDLSSFVIFSRAFDFEAAQKAGWDYTTAGAYVSDAYLEVDVTAIPGATVTPGTKANGVQEFTISVPNAYAAFFKDVAGYDCYGTYKLNGTAAVNNNYITSVYCSYEGE